MEYHCCLIITIITIIVIIIIIIVIIKLIAIIILIRIINIIFIIIIIINTIITIWSMIILKYHQKHNLGTNLFSCLPLRKIFTTDSKSYGKLMKSMKSKYDAKLKMKVHSS